MTIVDRLPGTADVVIRPLHDGQGDADAILALVDRCSPATLYRRFHGVARGPRAVELLLSGSGDDSFCAWRGDDCVGIGGLALGAGGDCGGEGPSGHLGVLIEDRWQRMGVGSALMAALVVRAREKGLPRLVADIQAENDFLRPLLGRIGPTSTSFGYGGLTVCIGLAAAA